MYGQTYFSQGANTGEIISTDVSRSLGKLIIGGIPVDVTWDAPIGVKVAVLCIGAIFYGLCEGTKLYFRTIPRSSPVQELAGLSLAIWLGMALSKILN